MIPSASAEIVTRVAVGGGGGTEIFSDAFLDADSLRHDTPLWRQLERLRRSKKADFARLSRQTAGRHLGGERLADSGNESLPQSVAYKLLQDPYFFPSLWPRGDIGRKRIVSLFKVIYLNHLKRNRERFNHLQNRRSGDDDADDDGGREDRALNVPNSSDDA